VPTISNRRRISGERSRLPHRSTTSPHIPVSPRRMAHDRSFVSVAFPQSSLFASKTRKRSREGAKATHESVRPSATWFAYLIKRNQPRISPRDEKQRDSDLAIARRTCDVELHSFSLYLCPSFSLFLFLAASLDLTAD